MTDKELIVKLRKKIKEDQKAKQVAAEILRGLLPQAFTEKGMIQEGFFDEGKMAHIKESQVPFMIYAEHRGEKVRFWKKLHDGMLRYSHSVEGRNMRLLKELAESLGPGGRSSRRIVQRPGVVARNVYRRGWEKDAKMRGDEVAE